MPPARRFSGARRNRPRRETTPLQPASPYGCAKAFATQLARVYRDSYGLFVCNGILYNHESPRRGENFVTRKIARAVARIARGLEHELMLGSLESRRDWGRAQDYVVAMWMMLQHDTPDDYVVATGETHSVRDFVEAAFAVADLPWEKYVKHNPGLRSAHRSGAPGRFARQDQGRSRLAAARLLRRSRARDGGSRAGRD